MFPFAITSQKKMGGTKPYSWKNLESAWKNISSPTRFRLEPFFKRETKYKYIFLNKKKFTVPNCLKVRESFLPTASQEAVARSNY